MTEEIFEEVVLENIEPFKFTLFYDRNGNSVNKEDAWTDMDFDLSNLSVSEILQICTSINPENLDFLGYAKSIDDVYKMFRRYLKKEGFNEHEPHSITWSGEGFYLISAFYTLGSAYISRANECLKLEIEAIPAGMEDMIEIDDGTTIYDKVAGLTVADIDAMIELACYYNYSGYTSEMLNDSHEEMIGYLFELDKKDLKKLYNEFMEN